MKLSKHEIKDIIQRLQKGDTIPEDYKYKLFPTKQKEYELVYGGKMRKEDILANEDGVFPVPFQVEKVFNGNRESWDGGWKNIIAFGDNLQFLKTIYENKDPLIKNKVKGKVKLIYIDPPFATESDFNTDEGAKAYSDRTKGADFVEFLRRRLILARELLAPSGSIIVHLDWKKAHYIKLVLDEVFGENNFLNDIIWYYRRWNISSSLFARNHDILLLYTKQKGLHTFNNLYIPKSEKSSGQGKAWQSIVDEETGRRKSVLLDKESKGVPMPDMWDISMINPVALERKMVNYPTQKPEALLERAIKALTNEGDIIFDFFIGSGTTAAVAEKLNRKWITCDIGKLSFYTVQKRILNIEKSKSLDNPKKKYGKPAKSFVTVNTGAYDLEKVFKLQQEEYTHFVLNLFEVEPIRKTIGGIKITGERKDGYYALVWPYWDFKDAAVDVEYLENLHSHIGKKAGDRLYIIAPASYVDFISDYYEVGKVRYYFLKVPYHIIKELHKVQFKKFRQPQSKNNVNDLDDAVGFHFMKQPDVLTKVKKTKKNVSITIEKFLSDFSEDDKGEDLENFESLAMVLLDKDFDGQAFDMDEYYFAEDLLPNDEATEKISLPVISKDECGGKLMIIYVDIFGNEFKEVFEIK